MKTKDQILLEEAYQKVVESTRPNYYEDAKVHPELYEIQLDTIPDEDWDGNTTTRTIAYLYKVGTSYSDYERIDNPDDIEEMVELFKQKNPEGVSRFN